MLGGGFGWTASLNQAVETTKSGPANAGTTWQVYGYNGTTTSHGLYVYAICATVG